MTEFTPLSATLGGALIGLSAVVMMLGLGRIAGISGIVSRLLPPAPAADWAIRGAFVAGLVIAALVWLGLGQSFPNTGGSPAGTVGLIVAGLLVGFGSVLGSGCTSGHGVCGLSRLSGRSIVSVAVFMAVAAVVVFVTRHVLGA